MLKELIDFVDASFPSIPYGEKEKAKEAIEQFNRTGETVNYLFARPLPELSQGDVLSDIPFVYYDTNGSLLRFKAKAMVVNTSCHIENKDYITLVPVVSLTTFESKVASVKNNQTYETMYIPDKQLEEYCVDFSMPMTYTSELIKGQIEKGHITRIASLSQIGYYLLLIKLNLYLMRREDPVTMSQRKN